VSVTALNTKVESIFVMLGWSAITSFILLNAIYQKFLEPMTIREVVLVFAISVLAGILLANPETIVYSYIGSLALTTLILYVSLTLPASLIAITHAGLRQALWEGAIGIVVRIVLVVVLVPCLVGSIFGGIIGERMGIHQQTLPPGTDKT